MRTGLWLLVLVAAIAVPIVLSITRAGARSAIPVLLLASDCQPARLVTVIVEEQQARDWPRTLNHFPANHARMHSVFV